MVERLLLSLVIGKMFESGCEIFGKLFEGEGHKN